MEDSRILELSVRIATNTAKVNDYLATNNLPQPSFDLNAPSQSLIPFSESEVAAARQTVLHDCVELRDLMLGPREYLTSFQHNALVGQQVITRFKLAEAVPIGGEITFADLAANAGLHEVHLRKILRLAIAQHIFTEPRPGVVAHSAVSRLIAENNVLADWLRYSTDDLWHAAYHVSDAMTQYPGSEEPGETAFALSNKTNKDMFRFFAENPKRSLRFAAAMRFFTQRPGLEPERVATGYHWDKIGKDGTGTVVDVGGSHGRICIELARRFPSLSFVVQDLDEPVVRDAERQRPGEIGKWQIWSGFLLRHTPGSGSTAEAKCQGLTFGYWRQNGWENEIDRYKSQTRETQWFRLNDTLEHGDTTHLYYSNHLNFPFMRL
ncbi:hypothetical protein F4677DRAFT_405889 [Hypoxylon crocopeplum]|nr:hypothetical protein F4677DRAFT_405889 [Hypoxylon crocopeplum]